ncbi:MAG: hypothetical protein AB7I04_22950 [Pseudomonadales bacterium]
MKRLKSLLTVALLAAASLLAGGAAAQSLDPALAPVTEREGTIQQLEFADNSMIFDGNRYYMAPDLVVEIRGTHGAFTMLQAGMKARIVYRVISGSRREVFQIEQLPDNYDVEGV